MAAIAWPVLFTILLWWASTGVLLYLHGMKGSLRTWCLIGWSVLALDALWLAREIGTGTAPFHAYLGLSLGIVLWAWHEMTFLMGFVTGPVKEACPPGAAGSERFKLALGTILWHELAIIATAAALAALTWGAENQIALWTFCLLWVMRLSAKLNLYFGVRNLSEEFLPERTRYLASYFRRASGNLFMPFALVAAGTGLGQVLAAALGADATSFETTGYLLLATLLSLAILEHLFLVLPLSINWLWRWGLTSHAASSSTSKSESGPLLQSGPARLKEVVR